MEFHGKELFRGDIALVKKADVPEHTSDHEMEHIQYPMTNIGDGFFESLWLSRYKTPLDEKLKDTPVFVLSPDGTTSPSTLGTVRENELYELSVSVATPIKYRGKEITGEMKVSLRDTSKTFVSSLYNDSEGLETLGIDESGTDILASDWTETTSDQETKGLFVPNDPNLLRQLKFSLNFHLAHHPSIGGDVN